MSHGVPTNAVHSHELVKREGRIGDVDPQYKAYPQGFLDTRDFRKRVMAFAGNDRVRGSARRRMPPARPYRRARPTFCCDATERKRRLPL